MESIQLTFKYPWRPEQERILNNVLDYLDDDRIHIVAAPGAGKTNLGLEIFNRLQLKTLIVSPTKIIRNQWIERLSDFKITQPETQWSGLNLHDTKFLTSTTYQGLFSLNQSILDEKLIDNLENEYHCISQWFNDQQIKLLILDEAHHLKSEWWKVLMTFVSKSNDLKIVSLTATPPYDASSIEWNRYQDLCGLVDEQISIPELVKSNSLCPHQDYIWLVNADKNQSQALIRYRKNLCNFIDELNNNLELQYMLSLHKWLDENVNLNINELLENLELCFALLSLIKLHNRVLPSRIMKVLSVDQSWITDISIKDWELLLQHFIQGEFYHEVEAIDSYRETLSNLLKSKRYLRSDKVSLDNTKHKIDSFSKSKNRVKACYDISLVEYNIRKKWMRLVVLADFIRDEKFQLSIKDTDIQTGAYPIFHYFIHHLQYDLAKKTVLLTGRLCIVHKDLISKIAQQLKSSIELKSKVYTENKEYYCINTKSQLLTKALTWLHQNGDVMILIGTRSLLGEGWDAPHVNSLIMATQTGAFVTTNQIRGRAIRVNKNDDLKTASIWHIISMSSEAICRKYIFQDLNKRFKTFAGLHAKNLTIETGIDRLKVFEKEQNNQESDLINYSNEIMANRLENDVFNLQARWQNALEKSVEYKLVSGLHLNMKQAMNTNLNKYTAKINKENYKKSILLKYLLMGSIGFSPLLYPVISLIPTLLTTTVAVAGLGFSKYHLDSKAKYFAENSALIFSSIVLETMIEMGRIKQSHPQKCVKVENLSSGYQRFYLSNSSHKENTWFLEALSQLIEPLRKIRYLICLNARTDINEVFAVPHIFGVNRKSANMFFNQWKKHLPDFNKSRLVGTHSEEGQRILLKLKAIQQIHRKDDLKSIRLVERWQ